MSESKSAVESLASELKRALAEVGAVNRSRQECLKRWSELRWLLQSAKPGEAITLTRKFELETAALRELDARLAEAGRKAREADGRLGAGVQAWALANRMAAARGRLHAA